MGPNVTWHDDPCVILHEIFAFDSRWLQRHPNLKPEKKLHQISCLKVKNPRWQLFKESWASWEYLRRIDDVNFLIFWTPHWQKGTGTDNKNRSSLCQRCLSSHRSPRFETTLVFSMFGSFGFSKDPKNNRMEEIRETNTWFLETGIGRLEGRKTVELPDLLSLYCFVDNGTAAAASDTCYYHHFFDNS